MERFWSKVQKTESCWLWIAGKDRDGYGRSRLGKQKARANRVAWELLYGTIADGLVVCHSCDQPACVRPDHLFLGTVSDNNTDRNTKGRQAKGETHHHKLSAEEVEKIRLIYAGGGIRQVDLAAMFGVSQVMVSRITLNKNWKLP